MGWGGCKHDYACLECWWDVIEMCLVKQVRIWQKNTPLKLVGQAEMFPLLFWKLFDLGGEKELEGMTSPWETAAYPILWWVLCPPIIANTCPLLFGMLCQFMGKETGLEVRGLFGVFLEDSPELHPLSQLATVSFSLSRSLLLDDKLCCPT